MWGTGSVPTCTLQMEVTLFCLPWLPTFTMVQVQVLIGSTAIDYSNRTLCALHAMVCGLPG